MFIFAVKKGIIQTGQDWRHLHLLSPLLLTLMGVWVINHTRMNKQRLPAKVIMRHSLKLLFLFLLVAGVMSSMYISDIRKIVLRLAIAFILFFLVFFINVAILSFSVEKKRYPTERTGKKIFMIGWLFTALLLIIFHSIMQYLASRGVHLDVSQVEMVGLENITGWRMILYLSYISFFLYSVVFLIQNFILSQFDKNRIEMELLELKACNFETTNRLLQQQIQPHFLFNALNVLKSLIKRNPEMAETYLLRLSDFLRVSVTGNKSGLATLNEELKFCEDYMEMQKIRFGNAIQYQVKIQDMKECSRCRIPFFSLQPLLENAIKHNELTENNPLKITIERQGDYLAVVNNLQPKQVMDASTGNGLINLQERYRLLSGDELIVEKSEDYFSVRLKLLQA